MFLPDRPGEVRKPKDFEADDPVRSVVLRVSPSSSFELHFIAAVVWAVVCPGVTCCRYAFRDGARWSLLLACWASDAPAAACCGISSPTFSCVCVHCRPSSGTAGTVTSCGTSKVGVFAGCLLLPLLPLLLLSAWGWLLLLPSHTHARRHSHLSPGREPLGAELLSRCRSRTVVAVHRR